ncbi:unnamed protein product [Agarophyton chilense]
MRGRRRPQARAVLRGHAAALTALTFHKSGDAAHMLYSGDEAGDVRMWDCRYEETVLLLSRPSHLRQSPILTILQHPHDALHLRVHHKSGVVRKLHLEYGALNNDLCAWNVADARLLRPDFAFDGYHPHAVLTNGFCAICHLTSAVWVGACAHGDQVAVLHDDRERVTIQQRLKLGADDANAHPNAARKAGMVMSVCCCDHDVLTAHEDGSLAVWDLRHAARARSVTKVAPDALTSVACSPFGRVGVAVGAFDKVVAVGDVTRCDARVLETATLRSGVGCAQVAWSGHGHTLATAGWDGVVRVWDGRRRAGALLRRVCSLRWHQGSVACVDYGCDDRRLASGGRDGCVALWDASL